MTARTHAPQAVAQPTATVDAAPSSATELRRFRAYTYWSLIAISTMVLLLFAVGGPTPPDSLPLGTSHLMAVTVVVGALLLLAARHIPPGSQGRTPSPRARRLALALGVPGAGVVAASWLVAGEASMWALAPAAIGSLLVADLPRHRRRIGIAAAVGGAMVVGGAASMLLDEPAGALITGGAAVTGFWLFTTLATIWTWNVVVQVDEARRQAASLAVANERLRFAADLHDIQGHSLQVIALKSELAARLVHRAPDDALAEMTVVRELAVDALRDTRSVVEGYRRTSIDTEVTNAANVLGSAGIDARLVVDEQLRTDGLPPELRHLLGLVVREAVTNVLRHSDATSARLRLASDDGLVHLTIANDGVGDEPTPGGGGLRQLAERLRDVGGRLTWRRQADRFEVHVELPMEVAR